MRSFSLFVTGFLLCANASQIHAAPRKVATPVKVRPPIDIVFAIDCSGSMAGVIETAKQKIWDIVNTAAQAKPTPANSGWWGSHNRDRI